MNFPGRVHQGAQGRPRQRGTQRDAADARVRQLRRCQLASRQAHDEVDGLADRLANSSYGIQPRQPRRIQNICAHGFEGLQPGDGVVQIGIAADEIFRPGGQDERHIALPRRRDGGGHSFRGMRQVIEPAAALGCVVFDQAAHETGLGRQANGFRRRFRAVAMAVLKVGRDRQVRRRDNLGHMRQHLVPADHAVLVALGKGIAGRGGGQCLETHAGQDPGAADVPGVWHDKNIRSRMQGGEGFGLGLLIVAHVSIP